MGELESCETIWLAYRTCKRPDQLQKGTAGTYSGRTIDGG